MPIEEIKMGKLIQFPRRQKKLAFLELPEINTFEEKILRYCPVFSFIFFPLGMMSGKPVHFVLFTGALIVGVVSGLAKYYFRPNQAKIFRDSDQNPSQRDLRANNMKKAA